MKARALTVLALLLAASILLGNALVRWPVWVVEFDLHPTIRVR
jgi:hypothetical protein